MIDAFRDVWEIVTFEENGVALLNVALAAYASYDLVLDARKQHNHNHVRQQPLSPVPNEMQFPFVRSLTYVVFCYGMLTYTSW